MKASFKHALLGSGFLLAGAAYVCGFPLLMLASPWSLVLFLAPKGVMFFGWPLLGLCLALGRSYRWFYYAGCVIFALHLAGVAWWLLLGDFYWGDVVTAWKDRTSASALGAAYHGAGILLAFISLMGFRRRCQALPSRNGKVTGNTGAE